MKTIKNDPSRYVTRADIGQGVNASTSDSNVRVERQFVWTAVAMRACFVGAEMPINDTRVKARVIRAEAGRGQTDTGEWVDGVWVDLEFSVAALHRWYGDQRRQGGTQ